MHVILYNRLWAVQRLLGLNWERGIERERRVDENHSISMVEAETKACTWNPKGKLSAYLNHNKNRRVHNIYNITQQQPSRTRKKTSAIGDWTPSLHDCSHFFFGYGSHWKREERESPIPSLIFFTPFHRHPLRWVRKILFFLGLRFSLCLFLLIHDKHPACLHICSSFFFLSSFTLFVSSVPLVSFTSTCTPYTVFPSMSRFMLYLSQPNYLVIYSSLN